MAAVTLDVSLADTVSSLDLDKVPDKLKCARCHQFNLNAYKTTCCDTCICESCFLNTRNVSCPECDHKPFTNDTCKPNKAMRNTVKAYLKTVEKAKADDKVKAGTPEAAVAQSEMAGESTNQDAQLDGTLADSSTERHPVDDGDKEDTPAVDVQPSIEEPDPESAEAADDDIEIHVDLDEDHQHLPTRRVKNTGDTPRDQSMNSFEQKSHSHDLSNNTPDGMNGMDFSNMMNGFNNSMDYNQMMQMMAANGMGGFNPMMGMPMGMNPMSAGMFGGFGGPNGGMNGMNGMNAGMNFNLSQGMYGWNNQNSTMWQNNNANAFSNGVGGDFGSNYGFNMGQSGNLQQQYPSGDFHSGLQGRGYGRGRGRGRGGFGRGRGNFNQYSQYQQGYQNGDDQKQHGSQNTRSQMMEIRSTDAVTGHEHDDSNSNADGSQEDDEFAPGGQEEVQEALGEDYQKPAAVEQKAPEAPVVADNEASEERHPVREDEPKDADLMPASATPDQPAPVEQAVPAPEASIEQGKPVPEAYSEDLQGPMPPPSAPLGPSAQYGDHGFRSRGIGRFSFRGRGSMSMPNGHVHSPVKSFPPALPAVETKGVGVVGAPTGPKAMREPAALARPSSRSATTGFQIMGRASMTHQRSESRDFERARSKTPEQPRERDRDQSRRSSRQEKHGSLKYEADDQEECDFRKKDKPSRRSKRDAYDDYNRDERAASSAQSDSGDKKASRRSRGEKERHSSSKQHSSRSRRHEEEMNGDYNVDDYDGSTRSNRDGYDADGKSKYRSSKSSKYDERDRDHDRDRDRDRDRYRERDKDRDRDREDKHRDRDRDRDRKRSRHDRHREDDEQYDYDYKQEADDQESRHRSRRQKKDHRRDTEDGPALVTGRSHRSSAAGTPVPIQSQSQTPVSAEAEKDPHTLEREARNRERMLKEQQRREKAAQASSGGADRDRGGGGGGGRRVMYKYEDDLERGLVEGERLGNSARWR